MMRVLFLVQAAAAIPSFKGVAHLCSRYQFGKIMLNYRGIPGKKLNMQFAIKPCKTLR